MKVQGVPFDQGNHPQGTLNPTAVVVHRTYGTLEGDGFKSAYSIGKNGRNGLGIGFHFLVGKNEGQWVQFYDTQVKAAHAKGANSWAIGIEFDGINEGPLTDWQVRAGAAICSAISAAHGIPLTYYDGARQQVAGYLAHASVPTSTHTDRLTREDWDRIAQLAGGAEPPPAPPAPIDPGVDLAAIAAGVADATKQVLRRGSKGDAVKFAQAFLNQKLGTGLKVDGQFGPGTEAAVKQFQTNIRRFFKLSSKQMPVDGIIGPSTWFWLTR